MSSGVPTSRRATELLPLQSKCTLGCPVLDALLRGGVATGIVTEVCGEATAGKTQFCLQLLLTAQWPEAQGGLNGAAVYIFTEGQPPLKRLQGLIRQHTGRDGMRHAASATDNILVENKVASLQDLQVCLKKILVMLYRKTLPVKLVVIDSIANLARDCSEVQDLTFRSQQMFQVAALMKEIASKYRVAVVVANQVVAHIEDIGSASAKVWNNGCGTLRCRFHRVNAYCQRWGLRGRIASTRDCSSAVTVKQVAGKALGVVFDDCKWFILLTCR